MEINLNRIEELLNIPRILKSRHQRSETFNLFTVLRGSHDEVRLHSRFLAELLNPNGTHDAGDLFLRAFIQVMIPDINFDTTTAFVDKEWDDIDIFIRNRSGQAIIIENKIDADDQENQLYRYYQSTVGLSYKNENIYIIYLSPEGKKPKDHSIKGIPNYIIENNYFCRSYKNHIKPWLTKCKKEAIDTPHLRESISQYISLLSDMTHTNQSEKFMEELLKWFEKELRNDNPVELIDAIVNAKKSYHANRIFRLKEKINHNLNLALENQFFLHENDSTTTLEDCKNFIDGNEGFAIWVFPFKNKKEIEVGFIANQGSGWVDVWCEKKKHLNIYTQVQSLLMRQSPSYKRSNMTSVGWKYLNNPIQLFESTDETLKKLSDDHFVDSLAEQISAELVDLVEIITKDEEINTLLN